MEEHAKPAVFMDRDGTLNEDSGDYVCRPEELRVYPWAAEAVRLINDAGFKAIVITNQSTIARGLCSEETMDRIHEELRARLADGGARLDGVYYCPHHPEYGDPPYRAVCDCRKPRAGLVYRAARDHNIDLSVSYVVGDKTLDIQMAKDSGALGALVLTGWGMESVRRFRTLGFQPDLVCENLLVAARMIVARRESY